MLLLPMQYPHPSYRVEDDAFPPARRTQREESPQTAELRKKVAGAMLSVMPSTRPPTPKRPKLSLQTSSLPPSSALGGGNGKPPLVMTIDSSTTRNTQANESTSEAPPPTPTSAINPHGDVHFPVNVPLGRPFTPPSTSNQRRPSPFRSQDHMPYSLPLGMHSILRNSPVPKRHLSAVSSRGTAKRMFPPVKKVAFQEKLAETMPTPVFDASSDEERDGQTNTGIESEEQHIERREIIQAEDGHSSRKGGRRIKRRREWIWRPESDSEVLGDGIDGSEESLVNKILYTDGE